MILDAVLTLIYAFLYLILYPIRILPDVTLTSGIGAAIATAGAYVQNTANFMPVGTLLIILTSLFVIEGAVATYKIIMWGIRRIPGQG